MTDTGTVDAVDAPRPDAVELVDRFHELIDRIRQANLTGLSDA
ncbi:hypothetical protein [Gordonia aurantiaca]